MKTQTQLLTEERQSVPSNILVGNPVKTDKNSTKSQEPFSGKGFLVLSGFSQPDLRYACDQCGSLEVLVSWKGTGIARKCLDCNGHYNGMIL